MNKILPLLILGVLLSCVEKQLTSSEQVRTYFEGFKNSDYGQIQKTIADSLTIVEGDYTMHFTPDSFYEQFKWDSVFKPVYTVVSLENENQGGPIIAKVSVKSLRFEFLKNNPLTCKHKIHMTSGKISKIENLNCMDANWEIWQKERDSLVHWIQRNHPELDGFVNDLSMKGAQNYLQAIKLYRKRTVKTME